MIEKASTSEFFEWIKNNDLEKIMSAVETQSFDINQSHPTYGKPVDYANSIGNIQVAKYLLEKGHEILNNSVDALGISQNNRKISDLSDTDFRSVARDMVCNKRFEDCFRLALDLSPEQRVEMLRWAPIVPESSDSGLSVAYLVLSKIGKDNFTRLTQGLSAEQCYTLLMAPALRTNLVWRLVAMMGLVDDVIRLTQGLSKQQRYEILMVSPASGFQWGRTVASKLVEYKRNDDFYRLAEDLSADQRFEILRAVSMSGGLDNGVSVAFRLLKNLQVEYFVQLMKDLTLAQRFEILSRVPTTPQYDFHGVSVIWQMCIVLASKHLQGAEDLTRLTLGLSADQCFEILKRSPQNSNIDMQGVNLGWLLLGLGLHDDFNRLTQDLSPLQCFEILKASPVQSTDLWQGLSVASLLLTTRHLDMFNRLTQGLSAEQCFEILKTPPHYPDFENRCISAAWILFIGSRHDFLRLTKNLSENQFRQLLQAPVALKSRIYSPLHFLAYFGKTAEASLLLDNNRDINQKVIMSIGKRVPPKAKLSPYNNSYYEKLYDYIAGITQAITEGDTALHIALKYGKVAMVELLLARGADPNLCDLSGRSALSLAVEYMPDAIVGLLNKGAIITQLPKVGIGKVIDYLYSSAERHFLLSECIKTSPSIAAELLADGDTLLHRVIRHARSSNHDKELLQLILGYVDKLDVNKRNANKQKAISLAIELGIEDDIIVKLAQHSTLKMQRKDTDTVLELCLKARRSNQLVQFLLERGACANEHSRGLPHLLIRSVMEHSQNTELLMILLEHGALLKTPGEMKVLLETAQERQVDERVLELIQSKIPGYKPAVAEVKQQPKPSLTETKVEPANQTAKQIQKDWDRVACWNATGNRWKKGGAPDDSFYQQIQSLFASEKETGLTREQIIEKYLKDYQRLKNTPALKASKIKTVSKTEKPELVKPSPESKLHQPSSSVALPTKKSVQSFSIPQAKNLIDWSADDVNDKKKKKQQKSNANTVKQLKLPKATENKILPLQLAANEALFLEDMCRCQSKIENPVKRDQEIFADVRKLSLFLIFAGISSADELLDIDYQFGGHNNNVSRSSLFTADDAQAKALRNIIMHKFPSDAVLIDTYDSIIAKNIGPRLKAYQQSQTVLRDLPTVDLNRTPLAAYEMPEINVNEQILELLRRISDYAEALDKEEGKQIKAFNLLDQQNKAKPIFAEGKINFMLVDVYTARAVESCLVWLGKCHTLYVEQDQKLKTLPSEVVTFIATVHKQVRNIFAHQVADNAAWHYSPININQISEYMRLAASIYKAYQKEAAQSPPIPPVENRFRLALNMQPFVPNAGNNNNNNNNANPNEPNWNPLANTFIARNPK